MENNLLLIKINFYMKINLFFINLKKLNYFKLLFNDIFFYEELKIFELFN